MLSNCVISKEINRIEKVSACCCCLLLWRHTRPARVSEWLFVAEMSQRPSLLHKMLQEPRTIHKKRIWVTGSLYQHAVVVNSRNSAIADWVFQILAWNCAKKKLRTECTCTSKSRNVHVQTHHTMYIDARIAQIPKHQGTCTTRYSYNSCTVRLYIMKV